MAEELSRRNAAKVSDKEELDAGLISQLEYNARHIERVCGKYSVQAQLARSLVTQETVTQQPPPYNAGQAGASETLGTKNDVAASAHAQLAEFKKMLEDGLITEEDYNAKKQEILFKKA